MDFNEAHGAGILLPSPSSSFIFFDIRERWWTTFDGLTSTEVSHWLWASGCSLEFDWTAASRCVLIGYRMLLTEFSIESDNESIPKPFFYDVTGFFLPSFIRYKIVSLFLRFSFTELPSVALSDGERYRVFFFFYRVFFYYRVSMKGFLGMEMDSVGS